MRKFLVYKNIQAVENHFINLILELNTFDNI